MNECDDNPNYCQVGGQCVNTPGSYRCLCQQGYEVGNGGSHCIGKILVPGSSFAFVCLHENVVLSSKMSTIKRFKR